MVEFINNLSGFNPIADFNASYKKTLEDLKKTSEMNTEINSDLVNNILKGSVTENSFIGDNELINDLKSTKARNIDGIGATDSISSSNELTADTAVQGLRKGFGDYLNEVNSMQKNSEQLMMDYAAGKKVDLHNVMIASEKAGLSLQLTMQMRNKILNAYQEIARMGV